MLNYFHHLSIHLGPVGKTKTRSRKAGSVFYFLFPLSYFLFLLLPACNEAPRTSTALSPPARTVSEVFQTKVFPLPTRQVHLDFHTSEHIPEIGAQFDKKDFQNALRLGGVNWINLFAKGHHGWSYYPTEVGNRHPNLEFDLLGRQIEAAHEIGVKVGVYYTVGWSANDAERHPEWCVRRKDGSIAALSWDTKKEHEPNEPRPIFSWKYLDPSGGYLDLMLRQTEEICRKYPINGFFYDITFPWELCYSESCVAAMKAAGVDVEDEEAVRDFSYQKWKKFMRRCVEIIHRHHPEATVFFNGSTVLTPENLRSCIYELNTHIELEDLPTFPGGYNKLPLRSKFYHSTGKPLVAMSGKFHTSWGEFGGFKHPDALRYEAASMIAYGAACNFGDQLHPSGKMEEATYRNIGEAFEYVQRMEAYGVGGKPYANLGLWISGERAHDEGVASMLLEEQLDFEVVNLLPDWSRFETIIVPGKACLEEAEAERLNDFAEKGGKLLVLGEGALDSEKQGFVLETGARFIGESPYTEDYLQPGAALKSDWYDSPVRNYQSALLIEPGPGTEVLATLYDPYFNRTYEKYSSHQNTPYQPEATPYPAAIRNGNVLYLAHPVGKMYFDWGARAHRDYFLRALRLLHRRPALEVDLPSSGRVSLLRQAAERRYVAHLLYSPPLKRGATQVIEDFTPLYDIPVALRVPEEVRRVRLMPEDEELPFRSQDGIVSVTIPRLKMHAAVVFEY